MQGLDEKDYRKYSRQIIIPDIGEEGQKKLKDSRVLIIGAGGLGSPAAIYLACAGVGTIGVADFDRVEMSNLHRQILHGEADLGKSKADSAMGALKRLSPSTGVILFHERVTNENAMGIIKGFDVVIDGSDNIETRFAANDACAELGVPFVYGSVFGLQGQVSVFHKEKGPCYRCMQPRHPAGDIPTCASGGVLGTLPGIIGTIQATEAVKIITGAGDPLIGRLLVLDALGMKFTELRFNRNLSCPLCSGEEEKYVNGDSVTPGELKGLLENGSVSLIDVREQNEWEICRIKGAVLIPASQFIKRMAELDKERSYVVYCHVMPRSLWAMGIMKQAGFKSIKYLAGGIDVWAEQIEHGMARY